MSCSENCSVAEKNKTPFQSILFYLTRANIAAQYLETV
jgi:hypothetical protein